ncbi:MAG: hypothetical protein JXQ23_04190 [Clostridia bacterium]|nr:hypothetical protein [Clostridia bacterium]
MKNKNENSIYLLLASLMTFSVSLASIQYTDLEYKKVLGVISILLLSFAFSFLCKPIFKNAISLIISIGLLFSTFSIIYFIKIVNVSDTATSTFFVDFYDFLKEFIFNWSVSLEKPEPFQGIIMVGIIFLISVVMHLSIYRFRKSLLAVIMAALIFTSQWTIIHEVNKLAFYVFLPTSFLLYIFSLHSRRSSVLTEEQKKFFQNKVSLFKMLLPLLLLTMFLMFLFPLNRGAIQIKWLDSIVKENTFRTRVMKYDIFSLADSGFSTGSGELNSRVRLDNTVVLNIYGDKPLYLKGAVYDIYNGRRWLSSVSTEDLPYSDVNNSRFKSLDELYYGSKLLLISTYLDKPVSGYQDYYYNNPSLLESLLDYKTSKSFNSINVNFFDNKILTIIYKDLETKAMFNPPYSTMINLSQAENVTVDKDEVFKSLTLLKNGQKFSLEYIEVDFTTPINELLINKSKEGFYYEIGKYLDSFTEYLKAQPVDEQQIVYSNESIRITYQQFEDNYLFYKELLSHLMEQAQYNIINYTALPDNVSNRTIELAYNLTKNETSNYEKVKNIQNYFKFDFTYSLSPMPLPDNREFVDFFLFESREGYCSSFATAMTVMVRSLGIPARYVEGYVMPSKNSDDNLFEVRNSNAHAWVEVYFEGLGWLTFEPTFAFSYTQNEDYSGNSSYDEELLNGNKYDDYLDNLLDENLNIDYDPTVDNPSDSPAADYSIGPIVEQETRNFNYKLYLIILLSALLVTNISVRLVRKFKFSHIRNNSTFSHRYLHIIKTLNTLKYEHLSHQTLLEFSKSIDTIFKFGDTSFFDITTIYYRIIYSNYDVTNDDCQKFKAFYKNYVICLRDDVDLFEYILKRFIFPII